MYTLMDLFNAMAECVSLSAAEDILAEVSTAMSLVPAGRLYSFGTSKVLVCPALVSIEATDEHVALFYNVI